MKQTVYNPQKGRLETIVIELTDENTTWFDNCVRDGTIQSITDFQGGLLIRQLGYGYPIWIYDISRADIECDQRKAKETYHTYV